MANIIPATLLFMAFIGIILFVYLACYLVKNDKENNKVVPSINELKFDNNMSYWEEQRVLWTCNQTDKKFAKMKENWER